MEAKTALYRIQQNQPKATLQDAEAYLAQCEETGLVPFEELHCLITDYVRKDGTHIHSMSTKRHYTVSHRWARQNGGYTIRVDRGWIENGNYHHEVSLVNNNDYAAVSRLASAGGWSRAEIEAELKSFYVTAEGIVTSTEASRKTAETGLTPEKKARKRALESAEKAMFGIEPGMARELYTAIAGSASEARAALYGAPEPRRAALPSPVEIVTEQRQELEKVIVDPGKTRAVRIPAWPFPEDEDAKGELKAGGMSDETAESIKRKLAYVAQGNPAQETNEKRRGLFCSKLEQCFDGSTEEKEDARRLVTWFLFDAAEGSSKALAEGQTRAWLAEYVAPAIEGDKYPLHLHAKNEMAMVYRAAVIATGQESLPGIEAQ